MDPAWPLISGIGALLAAIAGLSTAVLAYRKVREHERAIGTSGIEGILTNLGRVDLKKSERAELKSLMFVDRPRTVEDQPGQKRVRSVEELDEKSLARADELALRVAASFDRSCFLAFASLTDRQVFQLVEFIGVEVVELWAACYPLLQRRYQERGDNDGHLFFEAFAYLAEDQLWWRRRSNALTLGAGRHFDAAAVSDYRRSREPYLKSLEPLSRFKRLHGWRGSKVERFKARVFAHLKAPPG